MNTQEVTKQMADGVDGHRKLYIVDACSYVPKN